MLLMFAFASRLFFWRSMEAVKQNIETMFIPATQVIFIFTIIIIVLAILLLRENNKRKEAEQAFDELFEENLMLNEIIMNKNDEKI